jgi:exportin-5
MSTEGINRIILSLDVIYSPSSTNEQRHEAQGFLESIKKLPECPFWGYQLALSDNNYNNIVRHYALNLLLASITNHYFEWDVPKKLAVRDWIVELATKVSPQDPHYIKNKIAFLWVEVAKRCWGQCLLKKHPSLTSDIDTSTNDIINSTSINSAANDAALASNNVDASANGFTQFTEEEKQESWMLMDSNLLELWNHSQITRELSLVIFRTLFEDIYLLDDPTVSKRRTVLISLCPEIVVSEKILSAKYEPNDTVRLFVSSNEGWLIKWCSLLEECIQFLVFNNSQPNSIARSGATNASGSSGREFYIETTTRLLEIFKSSLFWILPAALREVDIITKLFQLLTVDDLKIQLLTIESFDCLYNKPYSNKEDNEWLVNSAFNDAAYEIFFKTYKRIEIDPEDIDDEQYTLLKKMIELVVTLSDYVINKDSIKTKDRNLTNFYKLVLETSKHDSLSVSATSLQFWCTMLRNDDLSDEPDFQSICPELLEVCANRLINYADCDSECTPHQYLTFDFDTQSDQATFLNEFKRSNDDIVRIIVCKRPKEALLWLADRLNNFFSSSLGVESLNNLTLTYKGKGSEAYIYAYSQFTIIEACVRGITRWQIWYREDDMPEIKAYLTEQADNLCTLLIMLQIKNPVLVRKQIQTLVQFTPLLKDANSTMFKVLERVIETCTFPYPENATDEELENIRDLRASSGTELNRLAYLMPETLKNIYTDLENVIENILTQKELISHEVVAFKSFLLVVSQRSSLGNKDETFSKIVDPELMAWSDPNTMKGLSDLHWFMERLGIVKIAEYFRSRNITANTDLLAAQMDDNGRALKKQLKDQWSSVFPIRATRILIQYSIEKLDHESETYQNLLRLWQPRIKPVIPYILQLIYQIQSYHNPANWRGLPDEVQTFVKYSTMERFWQQGISIQSRESFVDENVKAMHTLRDFADSVGHIIRYTREYAYLMIGTISELEDTLYGDSDNATLLWKALTDESVGITLHSWRHMINLVVRNVVKNCPRMYYESFMIKFLPAVFMTLDKVLLERWTKVYEKGLMGDSKETDEQLSEEMLEEHMLRQLTQIVDRMLIDIAGQKARTSLDQKTTERRDFLLSNFDVLGPFLKLLCDVIIFRDTRCTFNAILILRHISQEMISLNDPRVDEIINNNIIPILIDLIMDKFYVDSHSEAAYTLSILYIGERFKSNYPLQQLKNKLGLKEETMAGFENAFGSCQRSRERKNCLLALFNSVKNNGNVDAYTEQRNKMIEGASRGRKKNNVDGLDAGGLGNLFDE